MNMNNGIIIGVLALILIAGGWFVLSNQSDKDAMMSQEDDSMMQKDDSMMEQKGDTMMEKNDGAMMEKSDETMMKKEEGAMMDQEDSMMKAGSYEAYSPEKLSLAATGDVLLFFHATWCPICRGIESEIKADMSKIPAGVHILKVDYDTAVALRQKYGVTVQHTFVQVDASGNSLQKFSDASSLSDVLSRVK